MQPSGNYDIKSIVIIDFIDIVETALVAPFEQTRCCLDISLTVNALEEFMEIDEKLRVCSDLQFLNEKYSPAAMLSTQG